MAAAEGYATPLEVSVAYSPRAGEVDEVALALGPGATVADAIDASGLSSRYPEASLATLPVGIWGRFCDRADLLRDHDRVELYRPLRVDPMESRRRRALLQVKRPR